VPCDEACHARGDEPRQRPELLPRRASDPEVVLEPRCHPMADSLRRYDSAAEVEERLAMRSRRVQLKWHKRGWE
jgi:hypothetical protein